MKLLFLDIETTGTEPSQHSMIDLYAEYHVDGKKVKEFGEQFYNRSTAGKVDLGALKVNGSRIAKLYKLQDEAVVVGNFIDWLLDLGDTDKIVICGLNVDFDIGFIKKAFERYGTEGWNSIFSHRSLDLSSLAMGLIEAKKLPSDLLTTKGHSLQKLAKALDVPVDEKELHTAKGDTILTSKVYYKMIEKIAR